MNFTGQNQDTVAGMHDFMFREYAPVQGRWISPDPAGLAAVDMTNPQTWNRYAYVGNMPTIAIDPLGLYCVSTVDYDPHEGHFNCALGPGPDCAVDGCPPCYMCGARGFGFGFNFGFAGGGGGGSDGIFCGESVGLPCGLPPLPPPSIWDILGIPPPDMSNCMPICDATNSSLDQQIMALPTTPFWQRFQNSRPECDTLLDRGIGYFSLLRLGSHGKEWVIWGGAKYGAIQLLKKWGASAGADLAGFRILETAFTGVGSLVVLGSTLLDATCFMNLSDTGGPSPPWK